jgi:hypothetical protein
MLQIVVSTYNFDISVKFEEPSIFPLGLVPVSSVISVTALKLLALDPYLLLGTTFGLSSRASAGSPGPKSQ